MLLVRDHTLPIPICFHKRHPSRYIPFELVNVQLKCYRVNKTDHVSTPAPRPSLTSYQLQLPASAEALILSVQSCLPDLAGLKLLLTWTHGCLIFTPLSTSGTWASPALPALPTSQRRAPPVDMELFLLLEIPPAYHLLTPSLWWGSSKAGRRQVLHLFKVPHRTSNSMACDPGAKDGPGQIPFPLLRPS